MRIQAILAVALLAAGVLAGCTSNVEVPAPSPSPMGEAAFATFTLSPVGSADAGEPSVGVTASGCIFFVAYTDVRRSCNHGLSWSDAKGPLQSPISSDPYLWVDPVTSRIFDIQMVSTQSTWIAWSDDDGATWTANPVDHGLVPDIDHIKLATGPWVKSGYGTLGSLTAAATYPQAVYFCHNSGRGVLCYTSFDGGATFPVGATAVGLVDPDAGLHGAITTAPDGTVYVPPRTAVPRAAVSHDNGMSWSLVELGADAGTPMPRKNAEIATDTASNAYYTWIGKDQGVYVSRSTDGGATWDKTSLRASPATVVSATFPQIQAGDPGRIAIAYVGSENAELLGTPNIDGEAWDGNPHFAPNETRYDLFVTFSLDALSAQPTWQTVKLTQDPVQMGSICLLSSDCRNLGGSNRNLLDFNDLSLDRDGRLYLAYADGCTKSCATAAAPTAKDSRHADGMVAILETGPSLLEAKGQLKAFS